MVSVEGAITGGIGLAAIFGLVFSLLGLLGAGFWVWNNAPVVGGEWWFYIRIGATVVCAIIGAKLGAIVGYFVGIVTGSAVGGILG